MSTIIWQFQLAIPEGPAFVINAPSIALQAYDVTTATIGAGASGVAVNVQPSSTSGDVILVVLRSDVYDAGLTYKVDASSDAHAVDGPHVMLGGGAVGFMNGGAPPQTLTFTSTLGSDAHVQVLVGRKNP